MSLPTANLLYGISNTALAVGALLVLLGTLGAIWSGGVRDRYSDERIAYDEAQTASANERAAQAEQRAAEANLELARLKAPRTLNAEQQSSVAAQVELFHGQKYCALLPPAGIDTESLWQSLDDTLTRAGWSRVAPLGLVVGIPPAGVSINAPPGVFVGVAPTQKDEVGPAAIALAKALTAVGIVAIAGLDNEAEKDPSTIRIVIGLKPQR